MKKIDVTTGLVYEVMRPYENKSYTVHFDKILPDGVTLASVISVAIAASGNVAEITPLSSAAEAASGTKVSMKLSGGTDGEDYEITVKCTDSNGDTVGDDVMIKVRKAGLK